MAIQPDGKIVADSPDPVPVNGALTYTLSVGDMGPDAATGNDTNIGGSGSDTCTSDPGDFTVC